MLVCSSLESRCCTDCIEDGLVGGFDARDCRVLAELRLPAATEFGPEGLDFFFLDVICDISENTLFLCIFD